MGFLDYGTVGSLFLIMMTSRPVSFCLLSLLNFIPAPYTCLQQPRYPMLSRLK